MQTLYVALRERGPRSGDDRVDATEMVRRFDDVVHRDVRTDFANRPRLENPARLLMRQAAALDVVGVVGEVDLETVVDAPGHFGFALGLEDGGDGF